MATNQYNSEWTDTIEKRLVELRNSGMTFDEVTQHLNQEFHFKVPRTVERVKAKYYRIKDKKFNIEGDPRDKYGVKIKKNEDGTIDIDQLIEISKAQLKDDDYILRAHGYDPNKWDLMNHEFSMWNHHNKQDGTITLYASRVKIAPKKHVFDEAAIIEVINKLPNIHIPKVISKVPSDRPYLNIPLFDMHFGIADYKYYKPVQERILYYLDQPRKDVLFIIGQDLFHNDDFRGRTASGREIQHVDMEGAFEHAWQFYVPLIEKAIEKSNKVHTYYSIGNHDEFSAWSFVKALEKVYGKQVKFDTRFKERKVHMLGTNFVGMNHSDKKKMKKLPENFATEFPKEWSMATTREVFVGHEHKEEVILVNDDGGLVLRRMPTGNITDDWHDQMGYTTSHKRFQIVEYSEHEVRNIHYI